MCSAYRTAVAHHDQEPMSYGTSTDSTMARKMGSGGGAPRLFCTANFHLHTFILRRCVVGSIFDHLPNCRSGWLRSSWDSYASILIAEATLTQLRRIQAWLLHSDAIGS
ncbi:hypothetical protein M413DRAFT_195955 [Hebeloma cylindrosporum]|uniref:Uncharacterized protein n=1 Tax=Hebeloma cylindrosporum TaxID=76867 RepID=A0A0C2YDZ1_HEBCY|nr:hypothetical protein M413DRAFT_195955 [Hebeloma cylindrosporum h7]